MKTTEAILKRPYMRGLLEYRLFSSDQNGREYFGIEVTTDAKGRRSFAKAEDLTNDRELALYLTVYLFLESVDACQLSDVVEDLLPIEDSLPRILRTLALCPDEKLRELRAEVENETVSSNTI